MAHHQWGIEMNVSEILQINQESQLDELVKDINMPHVVKNQFTKAKQTLLGNGNDSTSVLMKKMTALWVEKLLNNELELTRAYTPIQGIVDNYSNVILEKFKSKQSGSINNPHFRRNLNAMSFDLMVNQIINPDSTVPSSLTKKAFELLNQNRTSFDSEWGAIKSQANFSELADKETAWDMQILQSPRYEYFSDSNIDRFKSFLRETDAKPYGHGAEFYCLITLSDGVPASKAGELVRFYSDEPTGFWDDTATKKINTITDIANLSLLRKLPSPSSKAAQFGSTFEKLADVAFTEWYQKKHGVKLVSVKNRYYSQMVNTQSTGDYRQGTDELYYDEKNDKYIVTDYKMPQVFSNTDEAFNKRDKRVKDDYVYQAALYKKAAVDTLPKGANVEARIVQFGIKGLTSYLSPVLSDKSGKVISSLKDRVVAAVENSDPSVRIVSHTIEPAKGLVNDLLLPALDYYNSFVNKGIAPVDTWKENKKYSQENQSKLKDLNHQVALLQSLANKITQRNNEIKSEMGARVARVGDKIQNPLSTTTVSRRMPSADALYQKAVKAGFTRSIGEFVSSVDSSSKLLDNNLIRNQMVQTGGAVGWDDVADITRVYREKNKFDNKPAIEMAADTVIEGINENLYQVTPKSDPQNKLVEEIDGTGPSNQVI